MIRTISEIIYYAFESSFSLLQKQKRQAERLKQHREIVKNENWMEIDLKMLREDWKNVQSDLKKASEKALQNVCE
jgi:hypothetical protein